MALINISDAMILDLTKRNAELEATLKEKEKYSFNYPNFVINSIKFYKEKFIPFIEKRIHQDSLLFASIASLTIKIIYFFIMDVQLRGLVLIFLFSLFYLGNYLLDIYHFYIRERFFKFLVYGMGKRALYPGALIIKDLIRNFVLTPDSEHIGNVIFRNVLFFLVYIRLWLYAEPIIFLITRIIVIYFLLFNQFLLTAYFLSFLLILSRMVFHVTDFTGKDVQKIRKFLIENYYEFVPVNKENFMSKREHYIFYKEEIDERINTYIETQTMKMIYPNLFNAVLFTFLALRLDQRRERNIRVYQKMQHTSVPLQEYLYNQIFNLGYTIEKNFWSFPLDLKLYPKTNIVGKRLLFISYIFIPFIIDYMCFPGVSNIHPILEF